MALLKNGIDLYQELKAFVAKSKELYLYAPYIKITPLEDILFKTSSCKVIVVRWAPRDLILGSSDVEVYTYCKDNNISLYRNPRLHLKAFVDSNRECIIGSANISGRALNVPESDSYNFELATKVEGLTVEDKLYFSRLLNESTLITEDVYREVLEQLAIMRLDFPEESDFDLSTANSEKSLLISSLPMSESVGRLLEIYQTWPNDNDLDIACAIHDLALYGLPLELAISEFEARLKGAFFAHPFVKAFLAFVDQSGEIYFGSAKEWVHKNCTDVPLPRKWEITANIQILFRWIVEMGDGKFRIDKPNFSERLYKVLN